MNFYISGYPNHGKMFELMLKTFLDREMNKERGRF